MMTHYAAIIIGAGQAGLPLATTLGSKGWKVALIERLYLGGSCINYGCTPTKTMIASAKIAHTIRRARDFGIGTATPEILWEEVIARKNKIVLAWRMGHQRRINDNPNVTLYRGEAAFIGDKAISVNGETLTADKIFINTGTSPAILPIEGIEKIPYLTNMNIMELPEIPAHLIAIGGNYLGLEFGQMFLRFGSRVTVIEHNNRIVPREDRDVSEALHQILQNEGMEFLTSATPLRVEETGGQIHLTYRDKSGTEQTLTGSHLLMAAGRTPNTAALNLTAAGVEMDKHGYIKTNEYLETNVSGIYALGDVKGGPAFTHISYNDYVIISHNLFNDSRKSIADRIVPYALFTDPELGRVGMGEQEARDAGKEIKVGRQPMENVARSVEMGEIAGFMKLIVDARSHKILGATVLGVNGGELVQTFFALMLAGANYTDIKQAQFIHPTLVEGFYGLLESVQ